MYWLGQTMLQISITTYGVIYQVSSDSDKSAGGQVTLQGSCLSSGFQWSKLLPSSGSTISTWGLFRKRGTHFSLFNALARMWHKSLLLTATWSEHVASPNWEVQPSGFQEGKGKQILVWVVSATLHIPGNTSVLMSYRNESLSTC